MIGSTNKNELNELLKTLIKQTHTKKICWKHINSLKNIKNLETINPGAFYLTFENEWHHLFNDSYYTDAIVGNVYLLHEKFESGRDGSITESYNLYLQLRSEDLFKDSPVLVSDDVIELKELIKAIQDHIEQRESIINIFLNKLKNL